MLAEVTGVDLNCERSFPSWGRGTLDKMAATQMLYVHFPATDGRTLILSTEPSAEKSLSCASLGLPLPSPPPPHITAATMQRAAQSEPTL
jgi:hypothetical protein